ncbi:5-amino-6-(5-phospho-D-ribitylamino)uracil phosphatase, chloroplastic-like isoform X3 [Hevea brasiliensis]|uniref:5-amino-6-(5-phospho-D-ribitylamino)uracil phosphatase, chloroplastic-like isoform X3 n=1 Tax=Hevea brasiliensis TaxID=3981 RepID=UPI0025D80A5F|nr:5-amino-6-(5-phospho-D-ribitylamino)uracil phosphatase, chloroplastic-like isoform X3 [Hevea brasiliensis]
MECSCSNFRSSSSLLLSPSTPSSRVPHSLFPSKLRLSQKLKVRNRLVIRNACGFDENGSVNGFPITPNKLFMQEAIGAEYGEGFETFRPDGPLKVDVADTRAMKLNVWKQLASEEGKEIPDDGHAQKLMLYAGADHVLHKILHWETAESEVDGLKLRLSQLYYDHLLRLRESIEGLKEWLDAVARAGIPCAVVSSLDRVNMVGALERMGLKKYFQAIVTEEDGMESIAHRFLSAAIKLDRKPSKCVVFEDDPRGITAAHNCTMMAVALIGAHPAYELVQADLAVASFNELSVINLRRLFANKGSGFMDRQKQIIEKSPSKRKLTIDTIF